MAPATSGRAISALLALVLVVGSACSSPPAPPPAAITVCFGQIPSGWSKAWHDNVISLPRGVTLGVGAVDGDLAFGQLEQPGWRGVGYVDLLSGRIATIFPYAEGVSGLGSVSAEHPWVVWEQLNSVTDMTDWSVHAFNLTTGTSLVLATGSQAPGTQPAPVVHHGIATWAQPMPDRTSQIRTVDLATRQALTLGTGRVSPPVYAGPYLLWSELDSTGTAFFKAVDAQTLQPAVLAQPLREAASASFLGGSPSYLIWSSTDSSTLTAMRLPHGPVKTYTLADRRHFFQFLQLAGDFVVWYSGITSSVLDLTTGKGFDLSGTASGSAQWIAAATPPKPGGTTTATVLRIPTAAAEHLSKCA